VANQSSLNIRYGFVLHHTLLWSKGEGRIFDQLMKQFWLRNLGKWTCELRLKFDSTARLKLQSEESDFKIIPLEIGFQNIDDQKELKSLVAKVLEICG
jgi:hypothetical protein